jgi:serine/threonine protein phosphatase 1
MLQRFGRNTAGRDLIVGDIHGQFSKLQVALDAAGFDPDAGDRLFSVGDLIDRGPGSHQALEWVGKPWFHAVQGNHEQLLHDYHRGLIPAPYYAQNGGSWAVAMTPEERQPLVDALTALPIAITLETERGLIGIVHANCQRESWAQLCAELESEGPLPEDQAGQMFVARLSNACVWDRSRIQSGDESAVGGVRAVVVGHTPLQHATVLGNVFHIDTGGWLAGREFTILDASVLEPVENTPAHA